MAWEDVPQKMIDYGNEPYAKPDGPQTLLQEYGAATINDVWPEHREDFEADLDYRLGACINLRNSKAWKPGKDWP